MPTPPASRPARPPWWRRLFDCLSGLRLATVLLLLLFVLTWLGTLEQVERGLQPTLRKYFDSQALFVIPELGGHTLPLVLPGTYWVGALLAANLLLGGIARAPKGWRTAGVLVAHAGILLLLGGAFVTHHFARRGSLAIGEGEASDVAQDYHEHVIEVATIGDGRPARVQVIGGRHLDDLSPGARRTFRLPGLPFDLEVSGWQQHARPVAAGHNPPAAAASVVDGYWLQPLPGEKEAERNQAGCYARVVPRDGGAPVPVILSAAALHPFTVEAGGTVHTLDLRKRLWPLPFRVKLEDFTAEFYPGTRRPAKFESVITRSEAGRDERVEIRMNEPMRHRGLTFFQASWGPQDAPPGTPLFSVFEVVENPADKWPEVSLYVVAAGLALHFSIKLVRALAAAHKEQPDD